MIDMQDEKEKQGTEHKQLISLASKYETGSGKTKKKEKRKSINNSYLWLEI